MDKKERDFKTTFEQWKVIVDFMEQHPILIKTKFAHSDGDKNNSFKLWEELTLLLNSMGQGARTMQKWQMAVGRWKSKVKTKACAFKLEMEKTGGGPIKAPPLNEIEERLMALYGWKAVHGDENKELGMPSKLPIVRTEDNPQPSGSKTITVDSTFPPPLTPLKRKFEEITSNADQPPAMAKKKVKMSTEKSRRFVSLNRMHTETLQRLTNIDTNLSNISFSIAEISQSLKDIANNIMKK